MKINPKGIILQTTSRSSKGIGMTQWLFAIGLINIAILHPNQTRQTSHHVAKGANYGFKARAMLPEETGSSAIPDLE